MTSLVHWVVCSPARLALTAPALLPREILPSRTRQLWRLEDPLPLDAGLLRELAQAHAGEWGHHDEAVRLYRRALLAEPDDVDTLFSLALTLHKQVPIEREEAVSLYRRALALEPGDADTLNNLAWLLEREQNTLQEAKSLYRRALANQANHIPALHNLASLLAKQPSEHDEAEALYRRAHTLQPENAHALAGLGYLLSKDHARLGEAEELLRHALATNPEHVWALGNLAIVLSAAKDAEASADAAQLCDQARKAAAATGCCAARAHSAAALGVVFLRDGDVAAAQEQLNEAQLLDPNAELVGDLIALLNCASGK